MNPWILTPEKFLKADEIKCLRRLLVEKAIVAQTRKQKKPVRDWMLLDLALESGLRASELAGIQLRDLYLAQGESALFVRKAKASRSRLVTLPEKIKKHLKAFRAWKRKMGESVAPEAHLFTSERRDHMSLSAIEKRFKKWARLASLNPRYSIHSTRHTYGTFLYKATKDLRLVQKQLGHASSQTTEIYADVLAEDAQKGVERLYA